MSLRPKARAVDRTLRAGMLVVLLAGARAQGTPNELAPPTASSNASTAAPLSADDLSALQPVIVTAPEPRYVAPTRRDRIGRIWAPVFINGQGPFRLVLDSGASTSGITLQVARALGLAVDAGNQVLLRGVVGAKAVPLVRVSSFTVGDLNFTTRQLPVIIDPLGGADGILGTDGMEGRRILIDFHHDQISIRRSHNERAPIGYVTIPFKLAGQELVITDAWVGNVPARAIIDTGGQVTIGNLAMRRALETRRQQAHNLPERIEDVTRAVQAGDSTAAPPILLGTGKPGSTIKISNDRMTFGDMHIFDHWHMTSAPAMMIGMDTLGRLDILIIDYRRHELQLRLDEG